MQHLHGTIHISILGDAVFISQEKLMIVLLSYDAVTRLSGNNKIIGENE